ncbi:MAG: hypothetical protein ABIG63_17465, partial [Chloroflexota bacterium]
MSRLYVLMEVCKTDSCDVDGNAVYHPVDGGRGELMWLRKDRVIECADEGPVYRVPKEGDTTISTNPFIPYKAKNEKGLIETATREMNECDLLCFPAPEREEINCLTCGQKMNKQCYPCRPCIDSGMSGNKKYAYWQPKD